MLAALAMLLAVLETTNTQNLTGDYRISSDNLRVENGQMRIVGVDILIEQQNMEINDPVNISVITIPPLNVFENQPPLLNNLRTSSGYYEFRITNLKENVNYTLNFHLQSNNQANTFGPLSLVTTSVQSVTVESIESTKATVVCHFLPQTTSDGCLVRWSDISKLAENSSDNFQVTISRANSSATASGDIAVLKPNTVYRVEVFSMQGDEKLHDFGIPLTGDLSTLDTMERDIAPIVIGVGAILCLVGLASLPFAIARCVTIAARKIRRRKVGISSDTIVESVATTPDHDTETQSQPDTGQQHGNLTREKSIIVEMNVCYDCSHLPTDECSTGDTENASENVYDDVVLVLNHSSEISSSAVANEYDKPHEEWYELVVSVDVCDSSETGSKRSQPRPQLFAINKDDDLDTPPKGCADEEKCGEVYENVHPVSGLPVVPRTHCTGQPDCDNGGTEQPERATLPLARLRDGSTEHEPYYY